MNGLLANQLMCTPSIVKGADAYDENGNVIFSKLMTVTGNPLMAESE